MAQGVVRLGALALVVLVAACSSDPEPAAGSPTPAASAVAVSPAPLAGRTVVVDPGHNGGNGAAPEVIGRLVEAGGVRKPCNTVGATSVAGYPEHALAWDVAQRLATVLRARGATVVLTRADDRGVGPCVDARARIAGEARADAYVSVHADGGPTTGSGFHVIEPGPAPDRGNAAVLGPSHALALAVRAGLHPLVPYADYVAGGDGLDRRTDLGSLNLLRVPGVLVELGNLRHAGDARLLGSAAWRERAAVALADGISGALSARR